ncbi:GMC oxidoreductase [Zasmidium cellare ATCC 36951]|uniref:GMC oxidoreductase n=1 Tax=Zasmidium cellare ATCC 36951 TaxID=1080233 RepID=A0A6A6D3D0_ZASCE|nr:GMC oxidoreductase [Zasmidium cellare ATCC 36951]KAF2173924.1 GMC oxidoreductase [Zasmidium cellare ATCC 36951]
MPTRNLFVALLSVASVVTAAPVGNGLPVVGSAFGVPGQNYTFDYVIVGGGNAGLTVAYRLAQNSALNIAVVEAGTFYETTNGNLSQIPQSDLYYAGKAVNDWQPGIDWGFVTTPQTGAQNARIHYPRGKCFGGSSARNYMTYHASTADSYQRWADYVGDQSYTFDNFYPFFKKSQNFTPPDSRRIANSTPQYVASQLGTSGPLSVIFPAWAGAFGTFVVKGLSAIGINPIQGFESGKLIGSSYALATIDYTTNFRDSSEVAFLQPAIAQSISRPSPNLIVFPNTLGKKIIFNSAKKATGVQVNTDGLTYTLSVSKEVIVSAGAFQSPQLLMVSGIGPAATLQQHGIPVLANRPGVGQNMTDHILFGQTYRVNVITGSYLSQGNNMATAVQQFHQGYGQLTNPNVDYFGWEKLPRNSTNFNNATIKALNSFPADWPDIEIIAPGGYFGYSQNYITDNPTDSYNYASLVAGLVAPLSRGWVNISSADTADAPLINPNWLVDPVDQAAAIAAFKRTRAIWQSSPMKPLLIGPEYFPGSAVSTDAQILDFIQKSFSTIFHAAVTCRMGRANDPNAVVDPQARVIGVTGVRVVDASSFALLPPGHPMSTVYALAEKISASILAGN